MPSAATSPSERQERLNAGFLQAVERGDGRSANDWLKQGAELSGINKNRENGLIIACKCGHHAMVQWLLDKGIERNQVDITGNIALHFSVTGKDPEMTRILLEGGCNPDTPTATHPKPGRFDYPKIPGLQPLHQACIYGDEEQVQLFIQYGANLELHASAGGTPLWYASANGHSHVCARLLNAGVDPEGMYEHEVNNGWHPLNGAKPADWTPTTLDRKNCLFHTASNDYSRTLECVLDGGANLHATSTRDGTALKYADRFKSQRNARQARNVLKRYGEYPVFEPTGGFIRKLQKSDLFAPNEAGWCLLDTPATWHHMDAICQHLETIGQPLSRAELEQTGQSGKSWLLRGIECFALPQLQAILAHDNNPITLHDLLDDAQKPTAMFETICNRRQVGQLFTDEIWAGHSPRELKACYNQLSPALQNDVGNLHQLSAVIGRPINRHPNR